MIGNLKEKIEELMGRHGKTWDDVEWYGTPDECWPMDKRDILLDTVIDKTTDELRSDFGVFGKDWRIHVIYCSVLIDGETVEFDQDLRMEFSVKKPETENDSPWLWRTEERSGENDLRSR